MTVKIDGTNTVANPAFTGADTDTGLQCGTNELKLVTGGSARATVDSSGRLLLGTTTARADLTVAKGNGSIPAAGASTGAAVFSNGTDDAVYGVVVGANTSGTGYIQSQRTDGTATTYDLAIQPNGSNVGIGTTTPVKQLQVGAHGSSSEGTIALASTTSGTCSILMGDGATGSDFYRGYVQYSNADDAMLFATSASERMRISSEGYVTKPSQPGIYLDGLDWSNTNNYMHNGHQFWQVGSNWNNTTGTWTCPVAGKYFVGADAQGHNTHTQTGASQQYANLVPRVNNGNVGLETVATTRADGGTGGGTATHTSFGFAIILSCNANDTIRVYSDHGFRTNSQNHLTIYLLG